MCPYCTSKKVKCLLVVKNYKILICKSCFIAFTNANENDIRATNLNFYDQNYIKNYEARKANIKNRFIERIRLVEKYKNGGLLLDIGCSLGYFLEVVRFNSKKRWSIYGNEINTKLARMASINTRASISTKGLPKLTYKNKYFDIITCFDVLEHSFKISENLKEIRRILKDNGLILLQSPNYMSLMRWMTGNKWDWWSPPDHVIHFSKKTLLKVLEENGFTPIYARTYEYAQDFLSNIRGTLFSSRLVKPLFYLLIPVFVIVEKLASLFGFGALILVLAKKK